MFDLVCGSYNVTFAENGGISSIKKNSRGYSVADPEPGYIEYNGVSCRLPASAKHEVEELGCRFYYRIKDLDTVINLEIEYSLRQNESGMVFGRVIKIHKPDKPLTADLMVKIPIGPAAMMNDRTWLPLRNGVGKYINTYESVTASYLCAGWDKQMSPINQLPNSGYELAIPLVTYIDGNFGGDRVTVTTDPYFTSDFVINILGNDYIQWTYRHPVGIEDEIETRAIHIAFLDATSNEDDAVHAFYHNALPDVPAGPAWTHDVAMVSYDFFSELRKGWFEDIDALCEDIPLPEDREKVLLTIHGWFDKFGRYTFDPDTKTLDEEWEHYAPYDESPATMTKKEIHRRINYAKSRGFKVALYFADGLWSGKGLGSRYFQSDRALYPFDGWTMLTPTDAYHMNPCHPWVRDFYINYTTALADEYAEPRGEDYAVDAFVWDETFAVGTGYGPDAEYPGYADRAFMRLVRDITAIVHTKDENIAFMTSECIVPPNTVPNNLKCPPYSLCCDGTFHDAEFAFHSWNYGIFPNYRNVLWCCNWLTTTNYDAGLVPYAVKNFRTPVAFGHGDFWEIHNGFARLSSEAFKDIKVKFMEDFYRNTKTSQRLHWLEDEPSRDGMEVKINFECFIRDGQEIFNDGYTMGTGTNIEFENTNDGKWKSSGPRYGIKSRCAYIDSPDKTTVTSAITLPETGSIMKSVVIGCDETASGTVEFSSQGNTTAVFKLDSYKGKCAVLETGWKSPSQNITVKIENKGAGGGSGVLFDDFTFIY